MTVTDLAEPRALADAVVSALASAPSVALVRGVGVFAVGADLREAIRIASCLEVAARHAFLVSQSGPLDALALDDNVAAVLHERARRHATSTPDATAPGSGLTHN